MAVTADQMAQVHPVSEGDEQQEAVAHAAMVGRREATLLDEESVLAVALLLVQRCRRPEPWVRAAVATLDRFSREVAAGDLPALLSAGQADPEVAAHSLRRLALRHDGLTAGQLASLAFGPRLWWAAAGVQIPWRPLAEETAPRGGRVSAPIPGQQADPDVRLLLLAVIGSGATEGELLGVRVRDAGHLDQRGELVPDLEAEPLAVAYRDAEGSEHLTFLAYEARVAVLHRLASRPGVGPDDPLLLPPVDTAAASEAARSASAALIGAGNDVNVSLCRATGDFFRVWGMPGARFNPTEEHS